MSTITMFISNIILEVLTNTIRQENQMVQKFITNYLMTWLSTQKKYT